MKTIVAILAILCSGCISTMDAELYAPNVRSNISACNGHIRFTTREQLKDGVWIELSAYGYEKKLNTMPMHLLVGFLVYKGHEIELIDNEATITYDSSKAPISTQFRIISYIGSENEPCLSCKKPYEKGFKMVGLDHSVSYLQHPTSRKLWSSRRFSSEIKIPKIDSDNFSVSFSNLKVDGQLMKIPPFHFSRQKFTLTNNACGVG